MSRARDLATFVSNADGDIKFDTDTLFIDSSENRVGIGTTSPDNTFHVVSGAAGEVAQFTGAVEARGLSIRSETNTDASAHVVFNSQSGGSKGMFTFETDSTERMRIDSSGNLLVGKTSASTSTVGGEINPDGTLVAVRDGGNPLLLNRLTSDGVIATFRKDGSTVGSIGSNAGSRLYIESGDVGLRLLPDQDDIRPCSSSGTNRDNAIDLGDSAARFDDIYATNGTIQTSDRNEKQDIEDLSEAELRVATAAKGLIKKYRWIDAVQEKGDDARIHVGIIAQDLQAAFEAEGLDAGRYAMFISSTWWEADEVIPAVEAQEAVYETQTDEEGNETQVLVTEAVEAQPERTVTNTYETAEEAPEGATERTRLGVRYPELLAFIIGAM